MVWHFHGLFDCWLNFGQVQNSFRQEQPKCHFFWPKVHGKILIFVKPRNQFNSLLLSIAQYHPNVMVYLRTVWNKCKTWVEMGADNIMFERSTLVLLCILHTSSRANNFDHNLQFNACCVEWCSSIIGDPLFSISVFLLCCRIKVIHRVKQENPRTKSQKVHPYQRSPVKL